MLEEHIWNSSTQETLNTLYPMLLLWLWRLETNIRDLMLGTRTSSSFYNLYSEIRMRIVFMNHTISQLSSH